MFSYLSKPIYEKRVQLKGDEQVRHLFKNLRGLVERDDLRFKWSRPVPEYVYRGIVEQRQFTITRRFFNDRTVPNVRGVVQADRSLLLTLEKSIEHRVWDYLIIGLVAVFVFYFLFGVYADVTSLLYRLAVLAVPLCIGAVMHRWLRSYRTREEWASLEGLLNYCLQTH